MTTAEILAGVEKLRVLVVGDVCLDRWCRYDPALADASRETGIERIGVVSTEVTPGAAGTVAANVTALGAWADVLGIRGDDGFGYELAQALELRGIASHLLLCDPTLSTFTYHKLINCRTGEEDLPRVDFVNTQPLRQDLERELVRRLESVAADYDVILVSDQAETDSGGVVTAAMRDSLARLAAASPGTVICVDSRLRAELFRGVVVKPNQDEAAAASQRALGRVDYAGLRRHMEAPLLLITHGRDGAKARGQGSSEGDVGVLVVSDQGSTWVAARRVEKPVDICGAGDSFSAGAAMALQVTGDPIAAARFGNLVASITIMKKGTGTASPEEVLAAE